MHLNDDLSILTLPFQQGSAPSQIHLSVLSDAAQGPTLVDTGLPHQLDILTAGLAELGVRVADLKRIILTHQDIDHVGLLHDLASASGAEVLAHATEIPAIDGRAPARFQLPEMQARMPALRALSEGFRHTAVGRALHDGMRLDLAGGVRVIFTPGHTPGHISLYLERSRTLIAGDALTVQEGRLAGSNPQATMDPQQARQSVAKLASLEVAAIVCYHGGLVTADAHDQLQALAGQAAA